MRKRLLLVEDDLQMLEELTVILQANNIKALTAATGEESLAIAEREDFDAALVDLKLPDCSGLDLVNRLKDKQPNSMFILMTAYGSLETAVQALKSGVQDYILKPFSPDEVLGVVRRILVLKENAVLRQTRVEELQWQNQILEDKIAQLRRLNELFSGREILVSQLRKEVNQLLQSHGQPIKYEGF